MKQQLLAILWRSQLQLANIAHGSDSCWASSVGENDMQNIFTSDRVNWVIQQTRGDRGKTLYCSGEFNSVHVEFEWSVFYNKLTRQLSLS